MPVIHTHVSVSTTPAQREALKTFDACMKDENYEQRKGFFKSLKDKFECKA